MAIFKAIREKYGIIISVLFVFAIIAIAAASPTGYIPVSNTAPIVSLSSIPSSAVQNQAVTITARAYDDSRVNFIRIYVDNKLAKTCAINSASGSCSYTTSALSAGTHTYYAYAKDRSGKSAKNPATGTSTGGRFSE